MTERAGPIPDPHLEHALHLIGENGDKGEIKNEIEAYVALYQREHMGSLPNNMAILYDYLTLVGDTNWYAAPAAVVSTKNVEAIRINSSGGGSPLTGPQVISSVLSTDACGAGSATAPVRRSPHRRGEDVAQREEDRRAMRLRELAVGLAFLALRCVGAGAADRDRHRSGLRCRRRRVRRGGGAASDALHLPGPGGQQAVCAFPAEPRGRLYAAGHQLADGVCAGPSGARPAAGVDAEAYGQRQGRQLHDHRSSCRLLDAHTGDTKSTWTVSETIKEKNAWLQKGEAMVTSAVNGRGDQYGVSILSTSTDFEKQPIGKTTAHLADEIRDTLPAHLGGFVEDGRRQARGRGCWRAPRPARCTRKVTYNYKHSVSHSYTLLANGLDQTLTIQDGVSTFKAPEGPLLLQFTLNDAPYRLEKEPIYQLSTIHSCKSEHAGDRRWPGRRRAPSLGVSGGAFAELRNRWRDCGSVGGGLGNAAQRLDLNSPVGGHLHFGAKSARSAAGAGEQLLAAASWLRASRRGPHLRS